MSKFALLIGVDDPIYGGGSSYADAMAFSRALKKYWGFDDSGIVILSSRGKGELYATRANVERQFEHARAIADLDSLVVGFWGAGLLVQQDGKRRFCLANFKSSDVNNTTVSLGSLLSATQRLHAKESCFICDCRPIGADGEPCNFCEQDCKTLYNYARKTDVGYKFAALAACSADERPIDAVEGEKGLFTLKLIEGIADSARRFQGSFDSVAGYAVQHTKRAAQDLNARQFPYFANAQNVDVRFEVARGFRPDEPFDPYAQDDESTPAEDDSSYIIYDSGDDNPDSVEEVGSQTVPVEKLRDRSAGKEKSRSGKGEEKRKPRQEVAWLPLTLGVIVGALTFAVLALAIYKLFNF